MGRMLSALVGVIGALWLGVAGVTGAEWWEHRPLGQPTWANVHVLWVRWSPPPGLAAQRDDARYQLKIALDGEAKLEAAVDAQDAAIKAQAAIGAKVLAGAEVDVARYRSAAAAASNRLRILGAPLAGDDVCARVRDADAKLLESLR